MDIPSHGTLRIRILVKTEQSIVVNTFHSEINIIECNLIQRTRKMRATASLACLDDTSFAQQPQHIADDNRIHTGTPRQEFAGHPHLPAKDLNARQNVHRNREFTRNLHGIYDITIPLRNL
jgi:predicted PhzF superfamily epimerase YddE/YHI9